MKSYSLDSWKMISKPWHSQVIYYPTGNLKHVDKVVLKHHKQGGKALGDYVINVLPTPTKVTIETIKTILETADEATSLEPVLSKIVAVIVKFCQEHNSNEEVCGSFKDSSRIKTIDEKTPKINMFNN